MWMLLRQPPLQRLTMHTWFGDMIATSQHDFPMQSIRLTWTWMLPLPMKHRHNSSSTRSLHRCSRSVALHVRYLSSTSTLLCIAEELLQDQLFASLPMCQHTHSDLVCYAGTPTVDIPAPSDTSSTTLLQLRGNPGMLMHFFFDASRSRCHLVRSSCREKIAHPSHGQAYRRIFQHDRLPNHQVHVMIF